METFTTKDGTIITYNNGNVDIQKSYVPAIGSEYYYISSFFHNYRSNWQNTEADIARYNAGNYFLTEAECDAKIEYDIALAIVRRAIKKLNGDWKPDWSSTDCKNYIYYYDNESKQFLTESCYALQNLSPIPCIKSSDIAKQVMANYHKELCIIRDYQF